MTPPLKIFFCLLVASTFGNFCQATSRQVILSDQTTSLWSSFKNIFGQRTYESKETELLAEANFYTTVARVLEHTFEYRRGLVNYTIGLNKFSDQIDKEGHISGNLLNGNLTRLMLHTHKEGKNQTQNTPTVKYYLAHQHERELPRHFDWRYYFKTRVGDQQECGSCWAWAAIGALECRANWYNLDATPLSAQELVDCSEKDGGCNGGLFDTAFEHIAQKEYAWPLPEHLYEYRNSKHSCQKSQVQLTANFWSQKSDNKYKLVCTGSQQIVPGSEKDLQHALVHHGAIPVAVHVTPNLFLYTGGIFSDAACRANQINHAVLLVGYGEDEQNRPFWILKNSWGEDWGEDGYFRLLRNVDACGVSQYAVMPVIAHTLLKT
jgi:cathepsin L